MKLTILQEKLKEGLTIVERVTGKSLSLPILNNILVKAQKNFLNLATTDLEMGINWWALTKIEREGSIVLPSRAFSSLVNSSPNKPINISAKDLLVNIEGENYKSTLKGLNPGDFPIIPSISENEGLTIPAKAFCQSLNQVVDIAAPTSGKPEISGVYFVFQKDSMKMVATDSFRLGEKIVFLGPSKELTREYTLILPQRAAREVINIFGEKEGDIKIYFSPNHVLFESSMAEVKHPQIQFISRLIEGEFPNYQEIIPKKYEAQVIFLKKDFLNQIKAASVFSGKTNEIKIKVEPSKKAVEIFSQNPELGEYRSQVSAKIKGKSLEASFNYRFLADGFLKMLSAQEKSQEVIFELTDGEGPGVLKPAGDSSYTYILMPIKRS